ncbi:MAG: AMP-binding protein, partial [Clostridia bacterium]|nr:AMP-binding protein [Clostridia bacterium]
MNPYPLNIRTLLHRPARFFPDKSVVSRQADGSLFRYTYRDFEGRVRRLCNALRDLGVRPGDRVATFAWNTHRHLELYFGLTCYGAVLHTINIRLSREHIAHILNHAEDVLVFLDPDLAPRLEEVASLAPAVRGYVFLSEEVPTTTLAPAYPYEGLLAQAGDDFDYPVLDEFAPAGMCYTSATTGHPKGVVYTQRSIYLHSAAMCMHDTLGISERDTILPVVPMFHANAWGLPFAGVWMAAKMVLPGPHPSASHILRLIQDERVTVAAAAVTIGIDMLDILEKERYDLSSLRFLLLGGQATPKGVMRAFLDRHGVQVMTAWGATEASPLATVFYLKSYQQDLPVEEVLDLKARQGLVLPGLELRVVDEEGREVAWDDRQMGEVLVRGPWVADEYYRDERTAEGFVDGWWRSGDIATINAEGVIRLVDRAKDLIKSGAEWISSVDLENELM